ncbi:MAG: aminotransferase class V-fold PLP-dependent enzyme [Ruminococcaceae bacterium]|nr:aminotransferase class V-fold PLP-dependent enzyme [Oscillospiraceae bacterium]
MTGRAGNAFDRTEKKHRAERENRRPIYLDNAATTWPKPMGVARALEESLELYGANPGRSSYTMAEDTLLKVLHCRSAVGNFFGLAEPERVVFTPGCTWSINTVLKGCLRRGDHVVISDMEHNAVVRPLHALEQRGISVTRAHLFEGDPERTVASFRAALRRNTRMIFCTGASNVFGLRAPVKQLGELCRKQGILLGVDAAQSAGITEAESDTYAADFICAPAHKGLYGTMGLGLLLVCGDTLPEPLAEGGTGSLSALRSQPPELPDRLESGTLNVPAICALEAGIGFLTTIGPDALRRHEYGITSMLYDGLSGIDGTTLYTAPINSEWHVPLISFNIGDMGSETAAAMLAERNIAVRAGFHCAYDAHTVMGTHRRGTVRICPSAFTTEMEAVRFLDAVREICRRV